MCLNRIIEVTSNPTACEISGRCLLGMNQGLVKGSDLEFSKAACPVPRNSLEARGCTLWLAGRTLGWQKLGLCTQARAELACLPWRSHGGLGPVMLRETLERGRGGLSSISQCPKLPRKKKKEKKKKPRLNSPPQALPGLLVLFSETHNDLLRFWPADKLSFEARQSDLQGVPAWER